ncbi:TPA: DUF551 domain-containing protein [Klebsiella pneumoniae]|uniref:DUF551 domain-containing protein n=1 Tax=Klebsiella pneumoniae TaxID=573 RepID=UPI0028C2E574|nr:DUF551 domain-containing protein [Klebsiella pneumoniae]HDY5331974.1 DUF551 domain-containing protein [Klebsiella pneumoniae]
MSNFNGFTGDNDPVYYSRKAEKANGALTNKGTKQAGSSLVIPDGYVMVPKEPTEAMINAWLSEVANWRGHVAGYKAMLAAAPQPQNAPQNIPEIIPGWIPVSERIPDNTEPVLCIEKRADFGTYGQPFVCWHDGGGWVGKTNYRPIVTHWMPLPAAPQEVKSE